MRTAEGWSDYELIDCTDKHRLERWGKITLVRPDPQVIWHTQKNNPMWRKADAVYHRSETGGGEWECRQKLPSEWQISWNNTMKLWVTPTSFKHTGVFPEQAANWSVYQKLIKNANRPIRVLNLFGYTGAATVACLQAGASVCHVDASKGMVACAKRNVELNKLQGDNVRYIVDDCAKFVAREARRGSFYDGIIMDPPSYGRGPNGEMWKLEDNVFELVSQCEKVLSKTPLFFTINSYTAGLAPSVMQYIVATILKQYDGEIKSDELGLRVTENGFSLPCGATTMFIGR